eukprot:293436-Pelagomonas_calceolata.AAC.1
MNTLQLAMLKLWSTRLELSLAFASGDDIVTFKLAPEKETLAQKSRSQRFTERKKKKRIETETTQAVKTLFTLTKEKRIPRAKTQCMPFTKRKKKGVNLIRRVTSSNSVWSSNDLGDES